METAFHRLLFFAESPDTPWPENPGEYTAFKAEYATGARRRSHGARLKQASRNLDASDILRNVPATGGCLPEEKISISSNIGRSAIQRPSANLAILRCRAFANKDPTELQTWRIQLSATGARIICEYPKAAFDLHRTALMADPRLGAINWDRSNDPSAKRQIFCLAVIRLPVRRSTSYAAAIR